jgi:hypothetical protein
VFLSLWSFSEHTLLQSLTAGHWHKADGTRHRSIASGLGEELTKSAMDWTQWHVGDVNMDCDEERHEQMDRGNAAGRDHFVPGGRTRGGAG